MTHHRRAATLLEILICITIVVVLVALVSPALTSARARAKETSCVNSMKQIYYAAQMYHADAGEYPPNNYVMKAWRPYINPQAIQCPAGNEYDRAIIGDYLVRLNNDEKLTSKEISECAARRGPAMPVIWDLNHMNALVARSHGERLILFMRADGSAHRRKGAFFVEFSQDREKYPCPLTGYEDNL